MRRVSSLLIEIISFLEKNCKGNAEKEIVSSLKKIPLDKQNFIRQEITGCPKEVALIDALNSISNKALFPIKSAIFDSLSELRWRIDTGVFYERGCGIGSEYLKGNMHTELVGPINGNFSFGSLRLGLFFLESNIFYTDHKHRPPELYLNLTSGTHWRFNCAEWEEKLSGSIVYNEPYKVHAMRVKETPFLSVWCWPNYSSEKCIIVPCKF